jgi:hypothetical protein
MFLGSNFSNLQKETIKAMMNEETGVKVEDRMYKLKKYKTCFIGTKLVDWLLIYHDFKLEKKISRKDAVEYGENLRKNGIFSHVLDEHTFKDEYLFYRFQITLKDLLEIDSSNEIKEIKENIKVEKEEENIIVEKEVEENIKVEKEEEKKVENEEEEKKNLFFEKKFKDSLDFILKDIEKNDITIKSILKEKTPTLLVFIRHFG